MDNILKIENLFKSYGRQAVLKGVNLALEGGKFAALFGPSGCGKSTLLNLIGLLDTADKGKINLFGKDVSAMSEREKSDMRRDDIGFVFQFPSLLEEFTVLENIEMPALLKGARDDNAGIALLKKFGLEHCANKMPAHLSGGEKQRAAMLRAVRNSPRLILADEPTGNLDKDNSAIVLSDLKELSKSGVSIIMATHNPKVVEYADITIDVSDGIINMSPAGIR